MSSGSLNRMSAPAPTPIPGPTLVGTCADADGPISHAQVKATASAVLMASPWTTGAAHAAHHRVQRAPRRPLADRRRDRQSAILNPPAPTVACAIVHTALRPDRHQARRQ